MRIFFTIVFIISGMISLPGQTKGEQEKSSSAPQIFEHVSLHTDRDFYLSGEKIWFKAYCTIGKPLSGKNLSNILYVELYNTERKAVLKKKFSIEEGKIIGAMTIPEEVLSGNYFLRAYTRYLRNAPPDQYFTSLISIVNPEIPLPKPKDQVPDDKKKRSPQKQVFGQETVKINIKTDKALYQQRALVQVELSAADESDFEYADLSVAIVKQGTFRAGQFNFKNSKHFLQDSFATPSPEAMAWIPDIRDVSLSGTLRDKSTREALSGQSVIVSVLGENPQIHLYKTREDGSFLFSLNQLANSQDVCIGALDTEDRPVEFLINNDFSSNFLEMEEPPLAIDISDRDLLEEMYINFQATRGFEEARVSGKINFQYLPFKFEKPEVSILLADYIELPTFEEVIDEIVTFVNLKKKKGQYYLSVLDGETRVSYDNPLVLLDNLPVFDANKLIDIPPSKIEKIEAINRPFQLGEHTLYGIVNIFTKTDDFAGIKMPEAATFLEYQTISPTILFAAPSYPTKEALSSSLPDFRNLLYWNPEIPLSGRNCQLSFYTSDHCSNYEIIVRGVTNEGIPCFGKASFGVNQE